jgi:hypothetical protein
MDREEVDKLRLGESEWKDIVTGRSANLPVIGLPQHLTATIKGGQTGYQYHLLRTGDRNKEYTPNQFFPSEVAALEALKRLLNWDPV